MPPLLGKSGGPDRCGSRPVRLFWNRQRRSVVLELSAQGPAQRRSGLEQDRWDQRGPWNHALTPQERGRQAAKEQARQRAEKNSRQPQGTAHTAAKTAPQDSRSMPSECHSGEQHAAKQGGRRPTVASPEAPRCTGRGMNREGAAPPSVRKPVPSAKQIKTAQRSLASGQLPPGLRRSKPRLRQRFPPYGLPVLLVTHPRWLSHGKREHGQQPGQYSP